MAITKKGKVPPTKAKPAAASGEKAETAVGTALAVMGATAKLTISLKRRLGNGDEIFIAPGIEVSCSEGELDAKQAEVTDRVKGWLETLTEAFPDPADADEESEDDDADEDADEDGDEDGDEDEDEDEDGLTEDEVNAMGLTDLKKLVKEQELDVDLKGLKVKEAREAVIEALFSDEDEDGDEDADEDGDEDDEDGDEDGEDGGSYDEDELKAMKLEDLQKIAEEWEIGEPKNIKKAKDLKAKKAAWTAHILAAQDEEE